jgi:hypothetical protein
MDYSEIFQLGLDMFGSMAFENRLAFIWR